MFLTAIIVVTLFKIKVIVTIMIIIVVIIVTQYATELKSVQIGQRSAKKGSTIYISVHYKVSYCIIYEVPTAGSVKCRLLSSSLQRKSPRISNAFLDFKVAHR